MAQRLVRIFVHADHAATVRAIVDGQGVMWSREWTPADDEACFEVLIERSAVEALLDPVQSACSGMKRFRALVLPLDSVVPMEASAGAGRNPRRSIGGSMGRVSREELYQSLDRAARSDLAYLVTVFLSTIVAVIGLLRDQPAVVIGAMVIAPLLGPNMALGLSATLADAGLALRAIRANLVGVALAFGLALVIGWCIPRELLDTGQVRDRTHPVEVDLVLALVSGIAGAMAFTTSAISALVGVMVAVALLPPLAVVGLHVAHGAWDGAGRAGLLLVGNVLCVNLAAVLTFLALGVRPRSWWEVQRARIATRVVLTVLGLGFLALTAVLWGFR